MKASIEIRPMENVSGYMLACGNVTLWFEQEVHAINHAQHYFPLFDVVVYDGEGKVKYRYCAEPVG